GARSRPVRGAAIRSRGRDAAQGSHLPDRIPAHPGGEPGAARAHERGAPRGGALHGELSDFHHQLLDRDAGHSRSHDGRTFRRGLSQGRTAGVTADSVGHWYSALAAFGTTRTWRLDGSVTAYER